MAQYINKSAVVAEIRKRLLPVIRDKHYDEWEEGQDSERIAILDIIDTLEGKDVIAGQECVCNGVFNKIIGDSWNLTIPLDKVGLKHGDKVEVLIIKR